MVSRMGRDEFAVLIRDRDAAIGETAAARISEMFNTPFVVDGITLDIEVSVGIRTGEPDHDRIQRLAEALAATQEPVLAALREVPVQVGR